MLFVLDQFTTRRFATVIFSHYYNFLATGEFHTLSFIVLADVSRYPVPHSEYIPATFRDASLLPRPY